MYYFSFTRFPSEKAHSLYIAKVAESFADIGKNFVVVVPRRLGVIKKNYSDFYGVRNNFKVVKLPCIDFFYVLPILKYLTFYLCILSFSVSALFYVLFRTSKGSLIFSNDLLVAFLLTFSGRKIVYELHDYPQESLYLYRMLFKRVFKIQTNNYQKVDLIKKQFSLPEEKIYTAHNGVTIEDFDIPETKSEARNRLGLDKLKKLVIYTGHLYDWKGVDTLIEVAKEMSEANFVFIGGSSEDVKSKKEECVSYKNIHFLGFKPHTEIPLYQRAADVLVVPNTAKKEISRLHTSPMKIFEYMASGTPIVATDILSVREVLNEKNAMLCKPDEPTLMADSIRELLEDSDKAKVIKEQSLKDVTAYTWGKRANTILNNIN